MDDGLFTFAYDAEGRTTSRTNKQSGEIERYQWNQVSQLTQVNVSPNSSTPATSRSIRYGYDQVGRRSSIAQAASPLSAASSVDYLLSDGDQVAQILGTSGAVTSRFMYGSAVDSVLSEHTFGSGVATSAKWQLTDHLGSVRGVAQKQAGGNTSSINQVQYDAYGRITSQTNVGNQPRFGFAGRDIESVGGMTYNRNRYYSTSSGRFISQDPISFNAGDANLYRYVGNSPTNATDPSGLETWREKLLGKSIYLGDPYMQQYGAIHAPAIVPSPVAGGQNSEIDPKELEALQRKLEATLVLVASALAESQGGPRRPRINPYGPKYPRSQITPLTPKPLPPKPIASEPVTPNPVTSKPVSPKPQASEPVTPTRQQTAIDEIQSIGSLAGKSNADIAAQLKAGGYSPITGNNGGTIWTKPLPDGNTAVVRVDPAMVRAKPKGFADEVPHVHKEIVPTNKVTSGNYQPSDATKLDDCGVPSSDPGKTHIPGGY